MRFDSVIYFISVKNTQNNMNDIVEVPTLREVLAENKSVRQSEVYQAMATGLKPELMFVTWKNQYHGEKKLKHENKTYQIIRTHVKKDETIELVCEGLPNG
ncbi:phage head closure protein [Salipaludibacillus sp. CF4.18]|uniref:phage head closure protein n=1 Tax=Salipaludibacillus sp. CF4.18 TaxID=3373081 RepID=UPI003EE639DA